MEHYEQLDMDRVQCLQKIVDELLKTNPHESYLKKEMTALGLPYSEDPVERINIVLRALHGSET